MTTILLADDHGLVRAGLVSLLQSTDDLRVVGQASDGEQAVAQALELRPDVVLMDLSMPVLDGVEATRRVVAQLPETHVVVLTSFSDRERVDLALRAGAVGYLLKDCDPTSCSRPCARRRRDMPRSTRGWRGPCCRPSRRRRRWTSSAGASARS
ncbi:MAG: response regulator transcription factor [Candidatus Nanopelagicales bacterium]